MSIFSAECDMDMHDAQGSQKTVVHFPAHHTTAGLSRWAEEVRQPWLKSSNIPGNMSTFSSRRLFVACWFRSLWLSVVAQETKATLHLTTSHRTRMLLSSSNPRFSPSRSLSLPLPPFPLPPSLATNSPTQPPPPTHPLYCVPIHGAPWRSWRVAPRPHRKFLPRPPCLPPVCRSLTCVKRADASVLIVPAPPLFPFCPNKKPTDKLQARPPHTQCPLSNHNTTTTPLSPTEPVQLLNVATVHPTQNCDATRYLLQLSNLKLCFAQVQQNRHFVMIVVSVATTSSTICFRTITKTNNKLQMLLCSDRQVRHRENDEEAAVGEEAAVRDDADDPRDCLKMA